MTQCELEGLWTKGLLPDVAYRFGDEVRAVSGVRSGEAGRVVALLQLEPSPLYAIELPNGESLNLRQTELELR